MERTTVYLPDDLRRRLAAAAQEADRPQAELVREALDRYLADRRQRPWPSFIGSAKGLGIPSTEAKAWVRAQWKDEAEA